MSTLILLSELNKLDLCVNKIEKNNNLNINEALDDIIQNALKNQKTLEEFLFDLEEYRCNDKMTANKKTEDFFTLINFTLINDCFYFRRDCVERLFRQNLMTKDNTVNKEHNLQNLELDGFLEPVRTKTK